MLSNYQNKTIILNNFGFSICINISGTKVGTIAQLTVIQDRFHPVNIVIVSNTHYFYHPKANYIRLIHSKVLLDIICDLKRTISTHGPGALKDYVAKYSLCKEFKASLIAHDTFNWYHGMLPTTTSDISALVVSVIITGDLNSRPDTAALEYIERYIMLILIINNAVICNFLLVVIISFWILIKISFLIWVPFI